MAYAFYMSKLHTFDAVARVGFSVATPIRADLLQVEFWFVVKKFRNFDFKIDDLNELQYFVLNLMFFVQPLFEPDHQPLFSGGTNISKPTQAGIGTKSKDEERTKTLE
jgi:hypothetical protein